MIQPKDNIRALHSDELLTYLQSKGVPKYRTQQIENWVWKNGIDSFDKMQNVPKQLREELKKDFNCHHMQFDDVQRSDDGTVKVAFQTADNRVIEGVIIPTENRFTACVSSQVGCSLNCAFCATGKLKRERNLLAYEIYDQVFDLNRICEEQFGRGLTNIVFMGMGEPLLNYKEVHRAIDKITKPEGLGMSPKRITLSTAGIAKMMERMADDKVRYHLALSLHAANDEKRSKIMAINDQNNLLRLKQALTYFHQHTGEMVTFEYIMLRNFNDTLTDAKELAGFCKTIPSKVNLIEYNPIDEADFQRSDEKVTEAFMAELKSQGIIVNLRKSRGKDIDAACGQLANKNETKKRLLEK